MLAESREPNPFDRLELLHLAVARPIIKGRGGSFAAAGFPILRACARKPDAMNRLPPQKLNPPSRIMHPPTFFSHPPPNFLDPPPHFMHPPPIFLAPPIILLNPLAR
jgi:hypothetical protein